MTKSVAIVAMGRSHADYVMEAAVANSSHQVADEVWAINAMGDVIKHDRLFVMDDLRVFVKRMQAADKAYYTDWMMKHDKPLITSVDYPEFPSSEAYPLAKVINALQNPYYYNSTVAYALALAIVEGFDSISLFGCDFSYSNHHQAEAGRGCVEFLMGIAHDRGVDIRLAKNTTLMDQDVPLEHRFYGYIKQPEITSTEEGYVIERAGGVEYGDIDQIDFVHGRFALRKEK